MLSRVHKINCSPYIQSCKFHFLVCHRFFLYMLNGFEFFILHFINYRVGMCVLYIKTGFEINQSCSVTFLIYYFNAFSILGVWDVYLEIVHYRYWSTHCRILRLILSFTECFLTFIDHISSLFICLSELRTSVISCIKDFILFRVAQG